VLKNAIDHGSRPYGANGWNGKPAALLGATPGVLGTSMAQQHLRNILVGVNMRVMGQPEAYIHAKPGLLTEAGEVTDAGTLEFLRSWCAAYLEWIATVGGQRAH
jgi:chromate reductase